MAFVVSSRGGPAGAFGYDAGVYYNSAAAFLHGAVPYRDFTLLHPPGLMLILTPFAAIGRITDDHTGFVAANAAFVVLASSNAALVTAISQRLGLSRAAGLLGGMFYALWLGAIEAEVSLRLEPLGSFLFLCGVWFLAHPDGPSRRLAAASGAAMGAATCVKIWWILPSLVVLAWLLYRTDTRSRAAAFAAGLGVSLVLVIGPFFVAAPTAMWHMVVTDQLARHTAGTTGLSRIVAVAALHTHNVLLVGAVIGLAAPLLVALTLRACRLAAGRLIAAVLGAQLLVLTTAPTYFSYYSGYVAPTVALLIAAGGYSGTSRATPPPVRSRAPRIAVTAAAVVTTTALVSGTGPGSTPFPADRLARGIAHVRCLMADSPMTLIELNALSRDLQDGCPNWVDVSGRTYDVDAAHGAVFHSRRTNRRWQSDILHYFRAGDAVIFTRSATGLSTATMREIRSWPLLTRSGPFVVYRTPRQ